MKHRHAIVASVAAAICMAFAAHQARAQSPATAPASEPQASLFAVEIKAGPAWDHAKPAHEQAHFREHSANLRKLRDQGSLVLGARYSDKGLIVLQADSEQQARALMDEDASIRSGVFAYELHAFNVFYGGSVQARPRRP